MSDIGAVRREVVFEPLPEHPVTAPAPVVALRAPEPAPGDPPASVERPVAVSS